MLLAPYFVVTQLNDRNLPESTTLKVLNIDSPARKIIENIVARKDVMFILAPMTDDSGLVVHEGVSPDSIAKFKTAFAMLQNISQVKLLFVLGNDVEPTVVVHESHHIQELDSGRLPLSKTRLDKLRKDLTALGPVENDKQVLVRQWNSAIYKISPEIPAIKAEYDFLKSRRETSATNFMAYLSASDHDYINKQGGMGWLNQNWVDARKDKFLSRAAVLSCAFLKDTLAGSNVESLYKAMFPSCKN